MFKWNWAGHIIRTNDNRSEPKIDEIDAICQKKKENKENQILNALTNNLNCTQESLDYEILGNWEDLLR